MFYVTIAKTRNEKFSANFDLDSQQINDWKKKLSRVYVAIVMLSQARQSGASWSWSNSVDSCVSSLFRIKGSIKGLELLEYLGLASSRTHVKSFIKSIAPDLTLSNLCGPDKMITFAMDNCNLNTFGKHYGM
jgi:hypothetical protein